MPGNNDGGNANVQQQNTNQNVGQAQITIADQYTNLKKRRAVVKAQATRFRTFLDNFNIDVNSIDEIKVRLDRLNELLNDFERIQIEIDLLGVDAALQTNERSAFETAYFKLLADAKSLIRIADDRSNDIARSTPPPSPSQQSQQSNNSSIIGQVKLPNISLPEFWGSYEHWIAFHDTFVSLIDDNNQLSDVQKFHYLKTCLKGEALQVIQSIDITSDNYAIAWTLLKERFDNKKLIINTHMKSIFELNVVKTESHVLLRKLLDGFNRHIRALKALGEPTESWNTPIIYVLATKLDVETKREWEKHISDEPIGNITIQKLTNFLSQRCIWLETVENKSKNESKILKNNPTRDAKIFSNVALERPPISCSFCKKPHFNYNCERFARMTVHERFSEVKKHRLCINCLRPGHMTNVCRSDACKFCKTKHHHLLHSPRPQQQGNIANEQTTSDLGKGNSHSNSAAIDEPAGSNNDNTAAVFISNVVESEVEEHSAPGHRVLLATAQVHALDSRGNRIRCRALLDSGSQINFITENLAEKLGAKIELNDVPVFGISGSVNELFNRTKISLTSNDDTYQIKDTFLVINKITDKLPQLSLDISKFKMPRNIKLADNSFYKSGNVDILLGANVFFDILLSGKIKNDNSALILQNTKLGWIIAGNTHGVKDTQPVLCKLAMIDNDLHEQVKRFWTLEEVNTKQSFTREEIKCENYFIESVERDESGRFQVGLPIKGNLSDLGDSLEMATKRLSSVEKRFERDSTFKKLYIDFINEYIDLGHMSEVKPPQPGETVVYLPHHGVKKEDSTTTKLRVVFDASAKTTSGISLNDLLMVGPVVQNDLFSISLKFRLHNVAFTGDIEKMYRQCWIRPEDRNLQRIVWRENSKQEIKHFTLNTISYGTAPASYLACRTLIQLSNEHKKDFPAASESIKNDFYMDDLITGAETVEQAIQLKSDISNILKSAGFILRKWASNRIELLDKANTDLNLETQHFIVEDEIIKVLGLIWNTNSDCFSYKVNLPEQSVVTKRFVLSIVARIFDPLSLIGPIIVQAKLILQRLWELNINWDDEIPHDLYKIWCEFYRSLPEISNFQIPRQVTTFQYSEVQMHGFSDASERAFGACIYIRVKTFDGKYSCKLLCAKSKIAPMKKITLPRLELNAALLLAKLYEKAVKTLPITFDKQILWSDSTIVLNWLASESSLWNTYVANRVNTIQELTCNTDWRHILTHLNPADIISRGSNVTTLLDNNLWWHGPEFLCKAENTWPVFSQVKSTNLPEKRKSSKFTLTVYEGDFLFNRFSNFTALHRVFTYMLRFINNCKKSKDKIKGNLTVNELNVALNSLLEMVQVQVFSKELEQLKKRKPLSNNSKLLSLNVFLDNNNLIRVGGRIRNSTEGFDKKHPIVLPSTHPVTKLIVEYFHKRYLHAGQQATLCAIRQFYWPIHGLATVRKYLKKCIVCFRANPVSTNPLMGDLPMARITKARAFSAVGIDFAGPILIKNSFLRNTKFIKSYICIFVCMCSKAVHIELATDLSTESFLNCLRRFASRRGLCTDIFCDNGSNFLGAERELKIIINSFNRDSSIQNYFLENSIKWHFNPPYSPNQGGLWESCVKSTKTHLKRIVGRSTLNYEDLNTVLCQIEACLNSRPLLPLSPDPEDYTALTPAHLVMGDTLMVPPMRDLSNTPINRLKSFEHMQQILQHFWKRWSSEYLTTLQQRSKWQKINPGIAVGDLVLLKEENLPPLRWKLGRVNEIHPGKDGITRVVTITTPSGTYKRSASHVCKLPLED